MTVKSMFTSYNERVKPQREDVVPVSDNLHHNIVPSDSIYYYRFPYVVLFKNRTHDIDNIYDKRRELALFKIELDQIQDEELSSITRTYASIKDQRMYVRSYADLKIICTLYYNGIEKIIGPIDEHHVDLLMNNDYRVEVRKPFYNKYDCKVYVMEDYSHSRWNRPAGWTAGWKEQRMETMQSVKDFLIANYPGEVRFLQTDWPSTDFYIQYDNLLNVMPFLKIQHPDLRFIITKCIQQ